MEVNARLKPPLDTLRFHVLAIFRPGTEVEQINRFIFARSDVPPEDQRDQKTCELKDVDLAELVTAIRSAGGLCILAHLNSAPTGMRYLFHQTAKDVLGLLDPTGKIPSAQLQAVSESFKTLLAGLDIHGVEVSKPDDRRHYAWIQTREGHRRNIPVLLGLDAHSIEDLAKTDRYCHVKMTAVSFDGLRAALKMPHTRIRFKNDLPTPPSPALLGISLSSSKGVGFFENALIAFSENLNCIIGPRGSGKSTLIDALRYVFGYNRTLHELQDDAGLIKAVKGRQEKNLRDTITRVFYRRMDGTVHVLEATYDQKSEYVTKVYTLDGHPVGVDDVEKCGDYPLRLFGWSEIETLGRDPTHQRELVDRLIPGLVKLVGERKAIQNALQKNGDELLQITDSLNRLFNKDNQMITHFTEYTNDFARLNTPEMQTQFASLDLARRKQRAIDGAILAFDEHVNGLRLLEPAQLTGSIERSVQTNGDDVAQWWRQDAKATIEYEVQMGQAGGTHAQTLIVLTTLRERLAALQQTLVGEVGKIEQGIRQSLAEDTQAQVEANQRAQAELRLAGATKARQDYLAEYEKFEGKCKGRHELLASLSRKQLEISGARSTQRESLVSKLNDFRTDKFSIGVDFKSGGDRTAMLEYLSSKGFLSNLGVQHKARKWPELLSQTLNPCELAEKVSRRVPSGLAVTTEVAGQSRSISAEESADLIAKRHPLSDHDGAAVPMVDKSRSEMLLALESIPWDDLVQITLNGQPVESLSPGQRSSAMLPLIVLSEKTPLVIDQPEDNLDNRLIGEVVADILASLKERRQVIAATHNPNIVVSGDAEQVIVLDAVGDRHGTLLDYGSIDLPSIIGHVITMLEGGREAFCVRRERYDL
jgi:ABC-type lipoprotein export system ATPase subunit